MTDTRNPPANHYATTPWLVALTVFGIAFVAAVWERVETHTLFTRSAARGWPSVFAREEQYNKYAVELKPKLVNVEASPATVKTFSLQALALDLSFVAAVATSMGILTHLGLRLRYGPRLLLILMVAISVALGTFKLSSHVNAPQPQRPFELPSFEFRR